MVTVTGAIETTNRPAFDPFADALFQVLGVTFDRAYAFSRAELRTLPQQTLEVRYPNWPRSVTVAGPKLSNVLAAAGASGQEVLVQAVDGYAPSFALDDIAAFVLAIDADGQPLAVGGRGPVWLVYPRASDPVDDGASDAGLVWAMFHIGVGPDAP